MCVCMRVFTCVYIDENAVYFARIVPLPTQESDENADHFASEHVARLNYTCAMTHSHECAMTHSHVCHDSFTFTENEIHFAK